MKALALAFLLALSQSALAAVPVFEVKTTPATTVTDGVGCRNMDGLKIFYFQPNPDTMTLMLKSHECFIVYPNETYETIDGTLNQGTIQLLVQNGETRIIPVFVFGNTFQQQ